MTTMSAPVAPRPVYISFLAEVTTSTAETLIAIMAQQITAGTQEVHLLLSTSGGNVMNAMALHNILRALPLRLFTYNVANVDSAGILVFLAGAERYVVPHGSFMFHGVNVTPMPGHAAYERDLRQQLDFVIGEQERTGAVYVERTRMSPEEVAEVFRTPRTVHAADAVRLGIVDMVREITIPVGSPLIGLVFPR